VTDRAGDADRKALLIERDMLAALVAAAPRGRPEIVDRLRLVTTELLKLELGNESRKARKPDRRFLPVPDGTDANDRTRWWDR